MTRYKEILETVHEKIAACGRRSNEVSLITVSKNIPIEILKTVYLEGGRDFGESRMQEFIEKRNFLPHDCNWHFIGNLQKNKVSKSISAFHLIHSVDTLDLAIKIDEESQKKGMITSILLQVNTSGEKTKHGLSGIEWEKKIEEINQLENIEIHGLMTMAPFTQDQKVIRNCFSELRLLRRSWKKRIKNPEIFSHLSMGMSHDYLIAIEEGATLLRIGSAIFSS